MMPRVEYIFTATFTSYVPAWGTFKDIVTLSPTFAASKSSLTHATGKFAILGLFLGTDGGPSNDQARATSAKRKHHQGIVALASTRPAPFIHFSSKEKT